MIRYIFDYVRSRGIHGAFGAGVRALRKGGVPQLRRQFELAQRRAQERALYADGEATIATYTRNWQLLAEDWYRSNGRPVWIVVPSYRDSSLLSQLLRGLKSTVPSDRYSVLICDDFSDDDDHYKALDTFSSQANVRVIRGERNAGFAANVNRGLAAVPTDSDVILMNSDVVPRPHWLASLQYSLHLDAADILSPKLVYPNETIQFAGGYRNLANPDWFDHLFRFSDPHYLPTTARAPVLFATGAVTYISAKARSKLGHLDEQYGMAFEDVDYSLRAWSSGGRVVFEPRSVLEHQESVTRGRVQGDRELQSKSYFWSKNESFFKRSVRQNGKPRVIFVTQDAGVGGGHRVIFHHLNSLARSGHSCELWNLVGPPDWYSLDSRVRVRAFSSYAELVEELEPQEAIKVATWWETAEPVWLSAVRHGLPAYLVQDIESSYYPKSPALQARALASYRPEFNYLTNTTLLRDRLQELFSYDATDVGLGFDSQTFAPGDGRRDEKTVLVAARGEPLKNFGYAAEILRRLVEAGWRVRAFGLDRSLVSDLKIDEFHLRPTDAELAELYRSSSLYLSTSIHEGFALPPIEAMACGCTVASTDAVGNREYLRDMVNLIEIPHGDAQAAAERIIRTTASGELVQRMRKSATRTAAEYQWDRIDARLIEALDLIADTEYAAPSAISQKLAQLGEARVA